MDKTLFLNLIEKHFEFQLNKTQLQFFYSSGMYTVMSTPRRAGKDFVALMDCLHTCTTPNNTVLMIVPTVSESNIVLQLFNDMINAFKEHIEVNRIMRNNNITISFTNNSELIILPARTIEGDCRGKKINKAIITEPDYINCNIEDLILRLQSCMCIFPNAQLKMIGTHGISKHNLMAYMMNPYFEKITASYKDIVGENYSYLDLQNLEESMDTTTYQLEVLNMITPTMLNEIFIN